MNSRSDRELRASDVRLVAERRTLAAATRRKRRRLLYGMFATAAVVVALSIAVFSGVGAIASAAGGGKLVGASFSSRSFDGLPEHRTLLSRADAAGASSEPQDDLRDLARRGSGLAGQALQCPPSGRVKTCHLLSEVAQRDVPVLLDQPLDL